MRERHVWIAVTAVLTTSLAWLAVASLVLLSHAYLGHFPEALAVLRALARAALVLGRLGWPVVLAALAAGGLLFALIERRAPRLERSARHA
jgi:hypothetical protein